MAALHLGLGHSDQGGGGDKDPAWHEALSLAPTLQRAREWRRGPAQLLQR